MIIICVCRTNSNWKDVSKYVLSRNALALLENQYQYVKTDKTRQYFDTSRRRRSTTATIKHPATWRPHSMTGWMEMHAKKRDHAVHNDRCSDDVSPSSGSGSIFMHDLQLPSSPKTQTSRGQTSRRLGTETWLAVMPHMQ